MKLGELQRQAAEALASSEEVPERRTKEHPIETKMGKKRFVREFFHSVQKRILADVDKMPDNWDGMELREYIADIFNYERIMSWNKRDRGCKKRLREYKNDKNSF